MKKKKTLKEAMVLLYKQMGSRLYGYIAFYKQEHPNQHTASKPYRASKPFVIGRYAPGSDRLVVFGSVEFLVREIRRLIDEFLENNKDWWFSRKKSADPNNVEIVDFEYDRHVMDFVILLSTHARNLFHLVKRVNDKVIPRLNYNNEPDGEVKLSELFDILIHNRYYYFDGGQVRDVFSERFSKNSRLSGEFMGYGFDLEDFIKGVVEVINDIRMKDLTQLLRWKFRVINPDSIAQNVVFLVQNLHSFYGLMETKISTSEYGLMTRLIFENAKLDGKDSQLVMTSPSITINTDLTKKEFEIRVRYGSDAKGQVLGKNNLKSHSVNIDYRAFFDQVNSAFGGDRLLLDFKSP